MIFEVYLVQIWNIYFIFDMIALLVFFVNTELDYKAVFSQDLTISANYGKNKKRYP